MSTLPELGALVRLYTIGYRTGHNDTVESDYIDVQREDESDYFRQEVDEWLKADPLQSTANIDPDHFRTTFRKWVESIQADILLAGVTDDELERFRVMLKGEGD